MAKAPAAPKPLTKTEIYNSIAESTGLSKKEVGAVFDELTGLIAQELGKGKKTDDKAFTIPGLCKIVTKFKPATKEHEKPDPFNPGQMMTVKAKPASQQVKIRPLKGLKDMVN